MRIRGPAGPAAETPAEATTAFSAGPSGQPFEQAAQHVLAPLQLLTPVVVVGLVDLPTKVLQIAGQQLTQQLGLVRAENNRRLFRMALHGASPPFPSLRVARAAHGRGSRSAYLPRKRI